MTELLISVIVPVFNAADFLERCVETIRATLIPMEIILVDDGSTDQSAILCDCLAQTDDRIQVLHQRNAGVSAARNAGLILAQGTWITFVDADDTLLPGALETMLSLAQGVDCVSCEVVKGAAVPSEQEAFVRKSGAEALPFALEDPTRFLTCHGKLLRRSVLKEAGLSFREFLTHGEDSELLIRLLPLCQNVCFSEKMVYRYTIHQQSAIHEYQEKTKEAYLRMLETVQGEVGRDPALAESMAIFVLTHWILISVHCVFNPSNPRPLFARWQEMSALRELPLLDEAFRCAPLHRVGLSRRISLCLAKWRLMPLFWATVRVRQWQNNRTARGKVHG